MDTDLSATTNMHTFVNHTFATQTNLFVALNLCRPLIPFNTQLGARQLAWANRIGKHISLAFFRNTVFTMCVHNLHNIWKQRYLRISQRGANCIISPKNYSHDAGWTKMIVVAQEGHIPDDQRGGAKIVTSPPCPRVLAS